LGWRVFLAPPLTRSEVESYNKWRTNMIGGEKRMSSIVIHTKT
jgi:hypothetical protein